MGGFPHGARDRRRSAYDALRAKPATQSNNFKSTASPIAR